MTVVDANVLLYAYNASAPQHDLAAQWLAKLRDSDEAIGLPWVSIWAFLRVSTNSRIWDRPQSAQEAFAIVDSWLTQPGVIALQPGPRHASILRHLAVTYGVTGPLVTDTVLAALVIENGALLASTDQDFRRFPELRWINPLST